MDDAPHLPNCSEEHKKTDHPDEDRQKRRNVLLRQLAAAGPLKQALQQIQRQQGGTIKMSRPREPDSCPARRVRLPPRGSATDGSFAGDSNPKAVPKRKPRPYAVDGRAVASRGWKRDQWNQSTPRTFPSSIHHKHDMSHDNKSRIEHGPSERQTPASNSISTPIPHVDEFGRQKQL